MVWSRQAELIALRDFSDYQARRRFSCCTVPDLNQDEHPLGPENQNIQPHVQRLSSDDRLIAVVASDGFDAEDVVRFGQAFGDRISPVLTKSETEDSF